jgi:hypothetical protein
MFWYGNVKWSVNFRRGEISMKSHTDVEVDLYASVTFSFGIGYDYQPPRKISWIPLKWKT